MTRRECAQHCHTIARRPVLLESVSKRESSGDYESGQNGSKDYDKEAIILNEMGNR